MDTFNPKLLALPKTQNINVLSKRRLKIPRHRTGEKFLKGPIPLRWIREATKLPGKSWHVASAIWYLVGMNNSSTIKLTQGVLDDFGVSRYSKYRALTNLVSAGLISVDSNTGKNPVVTVLDLEVEQ